MLIDRRIQGKRRASDGLEYLLGGSVGKHEKSLVPLLGGHFHQRSVAAGRSARFKFGKGVARDGMG
jgi:hypothetical protein